MTSTVSPSTLPALNADETAHTRRVAAHIREFIAAQGGVIGFDAFMRLALYAPGLGYYSAGATKLGEAGDFVTAPEVSSLFSQCLARQAAEVLAETRGDILELGAGSGRMAADVLLALQALGTLPGEYCILEVSADLAERQRARLAQLPAELAGRVRWLDRWPARAMHGVVLANEVLDAMPVERFVLRGPPGRQQVRALGVAVVGEDFAWREIDASPELNQAVRELLATLPEPLPEGYVSEICLAHQPWMASLGAHLERGVALLIDYGLARAQFYHPRRVDGTLRCHFRHRAHDDPFLHPGLQDLTAWVDFTRVAEAGESAGLDVLGFTTQASFLLGAGMEQVMAARLQAAGNDLRAQVQASSEARRLMLPGEMGEVFKVIALGRNFERPLRGFGVTSLSL